MEKKTMSHMQPQVVFDKWWKVETKNGTTFIPVDVVGDNPKPSDFLDYIDIDVCKTTPTPDDYEIVNGYGARLSAPGYLDCTEWVVFDTENQAREYLQEMYDDG
jgi:hypothetical protein